MSFSAQIYSLFLWTWFHQFLFLSACLVQFAETASWGNFYCSLLYFVHQFFINVTLLKKISVEFDGRLLLLELVFHFFVLFTASSHQIVYQSGVWREWKKLFVIHRISSKPWVGNYLFYALQRTYSMIRIFCQKPSNQRFHLFWNIWRLWEFRLWI